MNTTPPTMDQNVNPDHDRALVGELVDLMTRIRIANSHEGHRYCWSAAFHASFINLLVRVTMNSVHQLPINNLGNHNVLRPWWTEYGFLGNNTHIGRFLSGNFPPNHRIWNYVTTNRTTWSDYRRR